MFDVPPILTPYVWPTETCKSCTKTIPEKCAYCPLCGKLNNIKYISERYQLRLKRSTQIWCKHCFATSESYSHKFCADCGYNYKFCSISKI